MATGLVAEASLALLIQEIVGQFSVASSEGGAVEPAAAAAAAAVQSEKVYRIGFDVGNRVVERLVKDKPLIVTDLDVVKFICKEFWHTVFRKQVSAGRGAAVHARRRAGGAPGPGGGGGGLCLLSRTPLGDDSSAAWCCRSIT